MKIKPFALERYFAKYEFAARHLLSCSDCEPLPMAELLAMAGPESLAMWENLRLSYTETPGHPRLRESIANLYQEIDAEKVLVSAPEEGIFLVMQALLEPGDHVICTYPAYQSLYELARSMGCRISKWALDENRAWEINMRKLDDMFRKDTRLVVVNFPHNPTGYIPSRRKYELLVDRVRSRNVHLLSDEMYRFLELDQAPALPAACDTYDRAVSLSGMSKVFGLPGLRIGWIATRDLNVLEKAGRLKDYTTICNSAPSEILAIMALENKERIIGRQLERVNKNLKLLDGFFQKYKEMFQWIRPRGGSVCFSKMRNRVNTFEFSAKLAAESGIMLVPSRMFEYGDEHVRIGFGRKDLPEVLDQFSQYLDRYQG